MKLEECLALAAHAGFDGIELCLAGEGEFSLETSRERVAEIGQMAREMGLSIPSLATGLYWRYSPTASDQTVRAKAIEIARLQLEFAAILGAETILYIPGAVNVPWDQTSEVINYDVVYQRAREVLHELSATAGEFGVEIGVENVWNKFLLSPLEMCRFIDEIGHPQVGAYFDVGNVLISGYPEHWIAILGSRIRKVHVKDFKREIGNITGFTNLLQGDVNWPEVVAALEGIGYNGYITAEIMPPYQYHPEKLIQDISGALDCILGKDAIPRAGEWRQTKPV